ncbi:hypothetical protein HS088_TW13G00647 [Tripterygium wilfordii]|uniref:Uncharacterized protein n=1 Tax=Tripterygium wilfordii TaxID=458696 RepID=A0A7J7CUI0_TRIWF|nr:hypothetical protein HS088_TW13G00647 [Tripterygium wilfordii]
MAAIFLSWCSICPSAKGNPPSQIFFLEDGTRALYPTNNGSNEFHQNRIPSSRFAVFAATEGSRQSSKYDEKIPFWARPDSEEPPWAVGEGLKNTTSRWLV